MRILHVTREVGSDRRFGIGRSLAPIVAALQRRGHEVRYLTQEDQGPRGREWQHRWTQRLGRLGRRLFGPSGEVLAAVWLERLNMGRLAAKVARDMRADIVHLHDPWMAWGFRLARQVHRGAPLRWGITEHGFGCYSDATREEGVPYTSALLRWHRRMESRVLAAADWVLCPSHSARDQLARDLALPAVPVHWHAVPHARPELATMPREEARRLLGWAEGDFHVLAIGRLNPVKRFDALVRACLQVGRPLHLTVLGEGDATALHRLVGEAPQRTVTLQVAVVDDVVPYLCAADVYVSTSRNESFGVANLEALRAGSAAVCTAVGSVPEVTGGAAWLLPPADEGLAEAVAQALRALIDDAPRRRQMGAIGARHAGAWPDADAIAQRYEALYQGRGAHAVAPHAPAQVATGLPEVAVAGDAAVVPEPLCRLPQPMSLAGARRVLVLAPHPDDESIGCGGLLALLARAGVPVRVVLVSDGAGAGALPSGADDQRHAEFIAALRRLGVTDHAWLRLPDGALALDEALLEAVAAQVGAFQPNWIVAPAQNDLHRDHRVVAEAARLAACAAPPVQSLWQYETWGTIEATHVLDITEVVGDKLAALREHRTALAFGNYLEGTEGLARYRALLLGAARPGAAAEAYRHCDRETCFAGAGRDANLSGPKNHTGGVAP